MISRPAYISNKIKGSKITIANLSLRIPSLALRFILLYFIARDFSAADLGVWGIVTTSIALALYLVGLDFYTFSSREILHYPEKERLPYLRDQLVFYALNYLIIFPLLSVFFFTGFISISYIFIFYALLLVEHLSQESYRTLILFGRPLQANVILFLRSGSWIIILLILWLCGASSLKSLQSIFYFWMAGGLLSLLLSFYYFSRIHFLPLNNKKTDFSWIKKGMRISGLFFLGTAGYKIIDMSDRYFIQHYKGAGEAGVYIFFSNISNIIEILVYTITIIIYTPKLIGLFQDDKNLYAETFKKFSRQLLSYTLLTAIGIIVFTYIILLWLKRADMQEQFPAFILLVSGKIILNISFIFHYALYVRKYDRPLILSTLFAAAFNTILNFLLIPSYGMMGAAIATVVSLLLMLLLKIHASKSFPEIQTFTGRAMKSK